MLKGVLPLTSVLNQVIEDHARFNLLLKLRRGIKEEKFKFEVIKNTEGKFYVNLMP